MELDSMFSSENNNEKNLIFKDKKIKNGWVLNLIKQNEEILSTSLYDASGKLMENKAFLTQLDNDIVKLREYILLFEENPELNFDKMTRIKLR
jgi:hypothetical protein